MSNFSSLLSARTFSFLALYTICWTLPQTNTLSIESSTLFHLSQIFILWTNIFESNVVGYICSKINTNFPRFLKPCVVYIYLKPCMVWFLVFRTYDQMLSWPSLPLIFLLYTSLQLKMHYRMLLFDRPIMLFLSIQQYFICCYSNGQNEITNCGIINRQRHGGCEGTEKSSSLQTPCSVANLWWHFNYSIFRKQKF